MAWTTAIAVVIAAVWVWGLNLRQRWRMRHFPGPRPAWLLGNLAPLRHRIWPLQNVEWHKAHGKVFRVFLGREPVVIIADPDMAREVLIRQFASFHDRPPVAAQRNTGKRGAATEAGMVTARGAIWSTVRSAAQPMFHSGSLRSYIADMEAVAAKLVAEVADFERHGMRFDVKASLERMTMQVVGSTAFGIEFGVFKPADAPDAPLLAATRVMFQGSLSRAWMVAYAVLPIWLVRLAAYLATQFQHLFHKDAEPGQQEAPQKEPEGPLAPGLFAFGGGRHKASEDASRLMNNTSANLLANARAAHAAALGNPPPPRSDDEWKWWHDDGASPYQDVTPKDNSLIAMMLRTKTKGEGRPLRDIEIMSQTNVFIVAGYETTSVALTFAVYLLARHPEAEAKVLAEVDRLPRDRDFTHEELTEGMPYTAAVIDESLRMFPPAANSRRHAPHDTQVGPWTIPAGVGAFVDIWGIHHDPELWPEPDKFRPERFIDPAEIKARHPQAFLPFGLGPRNCIGYKFALQEARIGLARLFQNFTFRLAEPDKPVELRYNITIAPVGGIAVKAVRRRPLTE